MLTSAHYDKLHQNLTNGVVSSYLNHTAQWE